MQEGSSYLRQDGREVRERAERLQADANELVWFLVGAKLLRITLAGVMFEAMMAWASDAAEHKGRLQERYAALGTLIDEAPRLIDLARRDADVQAGLRNAVEEIATAAWVLRGLSPRDPAWAAAMRAFNRAMGQLYRFSGDQLRLGAERINLERAERVDISATSPRQTPGEVLSQRLDQAQKKLRDDAVKATPRAGGPVYTATRSAVRAPLPDGPIRVRATREGRLSSLLQRSTSVRAGRGHAAPRSDSRGRASRFGGR
jgi:hypothetical protein